jgi:hypothetical protein
MERIQQKQITVHPTIINITKHYVEPRTKMFDKKERQLNKGFKHNEGEFSNLSKKKMTRSISYLIYNSKPRSMQPNLFVRAVNFKITFVTLTLSAAQVHTDNEIKRELLNDFFTQAKRLWNINNYVWRAEKQQNNTIHFHVLTDKYIPWNELRNLWNRIQNKLGYVDLYRDNMKKFHKDGFKVRNDLKDKWSINNQRKSYEAGKSCDWSNPNSTDIHSVIDVHNAVAYVTKYMGKSKEGEQIEGRLWGCSESLSNLTGARDDLDSAYKDELDKLIEFYKPYQFSGDYFSVICIEFEKINKSEFPLISGLFQSYNDLIFNSS